MKQLVRRPPFVAAVVLAIACTLFFLRARSANPPDIIAAAPAVAATPPQPTPPSATAAEKVAEPPTPVPVSQAATAPARGVATAVSSTDNPAELWKRVGKGNTDAEVTLARLYLDGNGVTQNCEQARLLLQAAAKKRNRAADQVLSHLYPQRCP